MEKSPDLPLKLNPKSIVCHAPPGGVRKHKGERLDPPEAIARLPVVEEAGASEIRGVAGACGENGVELAAGAQLAEEAEVLGGNGSLEMGVQGGPEEVGFGSDEEGGAGGEGDFPEGLDFGGGLVNGEELVEDGVVGVVEEFLGEDKMEGHVLG